MNDTRTASKAFDTSLIINKKNYLNKNIITACLSLNAYSLINTSIIKTQQLK